jgi:ElaB/YqjD/DUF883 family membrane-anchored ribosome-binding protein
MQMSQSFETDSFQASQTGGSDDPILGDKQLVKVARTIGATAGYLRRTKVTDMLMDAEKHMMRMPESYVTAAAAIGFVAGIVLRARR